MEELISRITAGANIDESVARSAVRVMLSFLYEEGDREKMVALIERLPGAESYVDSGDPNAPETLGGFGGMLGGGVMAVAGKLQALGLGMGQIQTVAQETMNFAREHAGKELVDEIVASVPGLGQFV